MKLAAHYNRVSIIITLVAVIFGTVLYFFLINKITQDMLDEELNEENYEVLNYIKENKRLPTLFDVDQNPVEFKKSSNGVDHPRYFDTTYHRLSTNTIESGRGFESALIYNDENYSYKLIISSQSRRQLKKIISLVTLMIVLLILTVLTLANRYFLNYLWKPFFDALAHIDLFNVSKNEKFISTVSSVDEFNQLNNAIETMSERIKKDFRHLKQFTENASHEMLTPLAVITSKLDTLIQAENLNEDQFKQIQDIYGALSKLSRLNQSLLLLLKMDNKQITDAEWVDLERSINEKIRQFHELMLSKHISIQINSISKRLLISKYLLDILLNNLLSNAIRHNKDGGSVIINLSLNSFIVQNAGGSESLDDNTIFDRFQKGSKSDGSGLGLAIVKGICELYKWKLDYSFVNNLHTFIITFK